MADKNAFGLGPLDRVIAEYQQAGLGTSAASQPDQQPADQTDERAPSAPSAPVSRGQGLLPPAEYVPLFEAASRKYNVPVNVLMALGQQESNYNPTVRGQQTKWGRAEGMMQYLGSTARMLGINPYDPAQSVDVAARQIRERLDKGYSIEDAVKEHFAGPDRRLWGPKTAQYGVDVIGKARAIGAQMYGGQGDQQGGLDSLIKRTPNPNVTQGPMSTRQDGPMSIPAGTDTRKISLNPAEATPDAPASDDSNFMRRFKDSGIQAKALGEGTLGLIGDAADRAIGIGSGLRDWGYAGYKRDMKVTEDRAKKTDDVLHVWDQVKDGNFGAVTDYLSGAAGYLTGQTLETLAAAAAGAVAGSAIPGAGTVGGGLVGLAEKTAVKKIIGKSVESRIAALAAQNVAKGIAETEARTLAKQQLGKQVVGALLGSQAYNMTQELGTTYGSARDEKKGGQLTGGELGKAATFGTLAALTETVGDAFGISQFFHGAPSAAAKSGLMTVVKEIGKRAGLGMSAEGAQELVQTYLERVGAGQSTWDKDAFSDYVNSTVMGALGGGVRGGAGGAFASRGNQSAPADNAEVYTDGKGDSVSVPNTPPQGPISRATQAGNDNAGARRVVVRSPSGGTVTGFLDSYSDDGQGGFTARVLSDDGQPYQFSSADGVSITPENNTPAALPPPTITVDPAGNAATTDQRQQVAEQTQAEQSANRQRREQLGMTPDVDRAVQAHKERTSLPDSIEQGRDVSIVTRDGEVLNGKASSYERTENGARLTLTDQNGETRNLTENDISEVIPQEADHGATDHANVPDGGAPSTETAGNSQSGKPKRGKKAAPSVETAGATTAEPESGAGKGVVDATGTADAEPTLTPASKTPAEMSLDELVSRRKYLSDQATGNRGWDKKLIREKNRIEAAIRRIDPKALNQFKLPSERTQATAPEASAPVPVETQQDSTAVAPKEGTVTTPEGKPLVELFHPEFGERIWVRKDQWDAGDEKLAAFTEHGTRRFGSSQSVQRKKLTSPVVASSQNAEPVSAAPVGQNIEPIKVTSGLKTDATAAQLPAETAPRPMSEDEKFRQIDENFAKNRAALPKFKKGMKVEFDQPGTYTNEDGTKQEGRTFTGTVDKIVDKRQGTVKVVSDTGGDWSVSARNLRVASTEQPVAGSQPTSPDSNAQPKDTIKQGHTITLTKDIDYASAGVPYTVESVGKRSFYVQNPRTKSGTSIEWHRIKHGDFTVAEPEAAQPAKSPVSVTKTPGVTTVVIDPSAMRTEPAPDPVKPPEVETKPEPKPADAQFASNKIFTAERVAEARARLKSKISQLNSGIDPEVLMDGLTITGAYVESGMRDFGAYAKSMADDFGDAIKPYLLSFWEGVRNYPGLKADGMTPVDEARAAHAALISDDHRTTQAVGEIAAKPAKRTRKTGAKADMTLTQDWGTDHIDGYSDDADRETGNTVKSAFIKEARNYLNTVAGILTEHGYTPHADAKGRPLKPVSANEGGTAGSGDVSLTLAGPNGAGVYVHIGDTSLRGVVPTTQSGIAVMFRAAQNSDKYGAKGSNQWAPVDLSAADFAALVDAHVQKEAKNDTQATARNSGSGVQGSRAESLPADEKPGATGDLSGRSDGIGVAVDQRGDGSGGNGAERAGQSDLFAGADASRANDEHGAQDGRGSGVVADAGSNANGNARGPAGQRADESLRADGQREPADTEPHPVSAPLNYRIKPGEITREGSWKTTAERNVDIVELVKRLETEGRMATPEEKALLTRFTGWGASEVANGIFPDRYGRFKPGWEAAGERLKAALTPEEYANAKRSTQYAHYTSEGVIRSIYAGLERFGFKGGQMVEPGMGIGLFNGLMPAGMAAHSHYTGIEFDNITGAIAKQLYPASNIVVGDFTRTNLPKDFFDAAIGNPPFSSTVISNDPEYKRHRFMLHDYFFAKTIDRVRPGGVVVFVTSKGTMDKANDKARKYLADRANLIGAVRLPQTAFKGNAGTEVVTDVLFLQKKGDGVADNGVSWLGLKDVKTTKGESTPVNEYFAAHPEMVLGEHSLTGSMYRANEYTVEPRAGEDVEQAFSKAIERLPENVYRPERGSAAERAVVADRDFNPTHKKEGGVYVDDAGTLRQIESGSGVALTQRVSSTGKIIALKPAETQWLKGYVGVRDALKQAQFDQLNDGDWQTSMARLNEAYDAFVKKHGPILTNTVIERENEDGSTSVSQRFKYKPLFEIDAEGALVYGLEKATLTGQITKQPVFTERVLKRPPTPVIKTTQDALFVSLNDLGKLDIDHVAKLAGQSRNEVIDGLGTSVYDDPGAGWQTSDQYLSGNVVRKLAEARAAADINPKYKRNVDALLAVQPRPLGPTDITVRMGANWVPATDIEAFASEAIGQSIDVVYSPVTGDWTAVGRGSSTGSEWSGGDVSPSAIMDAVLNSRQIKVTYRDGEGKTHTDPVKTEAANHVAQKMKEAFQRWIWKDAGRADRLTKYYNEHFNNIAPRQYDGSHLTLPGVSARFNLYPHQKRSIWRVIQDGDTYLAHAVGAGKTFEMIAAGMEQRRLGLIDKPIYTVPNHMLAQFSREFLELYPTAHIMVADEQNFHTGNRRKFLAQAALNSPDAIVITHSAFSRLGMSDEYSNAFVQRQIDDWNAALDDVDGADRITKKQIQRRIEQLERRLEGKQGKEKKDRVLTFEELGADYLFVDEMHEFRKLDFATNQANIKGIDPTGSQRALDLYMKVEYLHGKKPGRAITGASGTPITNTMGELYTVQRFFQPEQLAEDGLNTFDAWAAQYGDTVTNLEQNAAGGYEAVTRFAKFQNVPELMHRVRSFMDILTNSSLGSLVERPSVEGGGRKIVVTPSPQGYKAYQKELEARIKAIRARTGPPEKGQDIILNVIADGRFSAIDMRFVDPTLASDPDSKLNRVIDDAIEQYRATADNQYQTNGVADPLKGSSIILFADYGLGDQAAAKRGFSMRGWIEKRLSDAGIPPDHVAFMRDFKQHAKKERLFSDMRDGKKRILIGGKDMETGVNVQKRLKFLGHIDAPWFPASVEQREGRIVRQGNQNQDVEIRAYATKGSYDSTMWGMNARKARFIEQAMNGDDSVRSLDDVSEASSFEMASALASGDERYLKLAGLRGDVERMERLRQAHYDSQNTLRREKHWAESAVERKGRLAGELEAAIAKRKPIVAGEFEGKVGDTTFDARDEFSAALFNAFKEKVGEQATADATLGEIGGFKIRFAGFRGEKSYMADVQVDVPDSEPILNYPIDEGMAINGLATKASNQVNGLDRRLTMAKQDVAHAEREIKQIESRLGAPFDEEANLMDKVAQLNELESELTAESKAQAEADKAAQPATQPNQGDVRYSAAPATDTPAFKKWFGDSKVVDAEGKPLVVYHGTDEVFSSFDDEMIGESTGILDFGSGFYFIDNPATASQYATHETVGRMRDGANVMPVYLSLKNPATNEILDSDDARAVIEDGYWTDLRDWLSDRGYDGVAYHHRNGTTEYVAFSPEQIKSASGNRGTFDAANPDIRYSAKVDGNTVSASARAANELSNQKPLDVRSTPAERDMPITALRDQVFEGLRDRTDLSNPEVGNIAINRRDWSKSRANGADRAKLLTVPYLADIIKDGAYLGSQPAPGKSAGIAGYHYIARRVNVDGVPLTALVTVEQKADGTLAYYNHSILNDNFASGKTGAVDGVMASYRRPMFTPDGPVSRDQALPMAHAGNHEALLRGAMGSLVDRLIGTGHIVLHPNEMTLPDSVQLRGGTAIQGFTDNTGKVHLVTENLTPQTVMPVLLHEMFHAKGRNLLGTAKWNNLQKQVERFYQAAQTRKAEGRIKDGDFWDGALRRVDAVKEDGAISPERAVEEFAAYAIENHEMAPSGIKKWVDNFLGMVKDWLYRRFGLQAGEVTPAQLRALALAALRETGRTTPQTTRAFAGSALGEGAMSVEDRHFVNDALMALAEHDEFFRYPKSTQHTIEGVFADVMPTAKYVGVEPIIESDRADAHGADRFYRLSTQEGNQIKVYEDANRVWLDVSEMKEGERGSAAYAAVGNYAHNTGRTFIGDPSGLSTVALRRRTEAMLASALKFGTTEHLEPHPDQLAGNKDEGVPPLKWNAGDDLGNMRSLIDVSLESLAANVPEFRNARYDFNTRTFVTSDGKPLLDETLDGWNARRKVRASRAGRNTLKRAIFIASLVRADSGERPRLLEQLFRHGAEHVSNGASLNRVSYSAKERTSALKEAVSTLDANDRVNPDEIGGLNDFAGRAIRDMDSRYMKYVAHPRHIAAMFKDFVPVFKTANDQQHARNQILEALHTDYKAYDTLKQAGKDRVNRVLELGRLTGNVYSATELKAGITNPGYINTVVRDAKGEPHRVRQPFDAALSKSGDKVSLSPEEITAYQHLRTMFDNALDRFRNQALVDLGLGDYAKQADPLKAMRDSIKGLPDNLGEVVRMKNAIQFIEDIEQSKRTGYVPFSRYGDYVLAVKERKADIRYTEDGEGSFLASNIPADMEESLDRMGAVYDQKAKAWRVTPEQRRDLERENERTIYSEKVETGLRDKFGKNAESKVRAQERNVENIPSVKAARERIIRDHVKGHDGRRVVSFETTKKRGEGGIDLSALDALAEVAQIDNPTWDAVRGELMKALQAGGFRKHFFQSSHVPGYTTDFQRAMADYIVGMAGYLSRRQHNDAWDAALRDIKGDALHEYATKYRGYFNDPREEFAALRQAAFVWKIGANISSAAVNLTQTLLTTVPTLNQIAGNATVAMELARAAKDAMKMMTPKAGTNIFDMAKAPADLRAEFARADAAGLFLPLNSFDLMGQANQRSARARKIQAAGNAVTSVISLPFSASERFNRIVAFTAAARLARKPGMAQRIRQRFSSDEWAHESFGKEFTPYDFAEWLASETQFQMGKINRPAMMRGAGAAMLQFKSFTLQMMEKMYRDWTLHGVKGKISVFSTLAMLVAFSGLWGVPGADDLRKFLEFMYKQVSGKAIDIKDEMRQGLFAATDNLMVTDALSSGMPYHYGMDLSQRVGMGNIMPQQYNKTGVDWLDMATMVGGPGFDMLVAAPIRATGQLATGDINGAMQELAPVWAKNPMKAYDWGTDAVRTKRGDKVLDKSEISGTDVAMKAIGIQPSRVSRQYEMSSAQYNAQRSSDDLKRSLKMNLVRALNRSDANTDATRRTALSADIDKAFKAIDDYNANAAPDQRIKADARSLRKMQQREEMGGESVLRRAPKASRESAATRAEAYGIGLGR